MTTADTGDRAATGAITFREATDADYDFLRRLYHATREEEMQHFPFDTTQKLIFLNEQFAAQYQHYRIHYPTCERNIIEMDGRPIGRMWVDEWKDQIRLVDIALMPAYRAGGIGTRLLRDLFERGTKAGKPVTIHVESFNPALRLYERLGFEKVDTNGVYYLMKWTPPAAK